MPKSKSFLEKIIQPLFARNGRGGREEDDLESIAARERKLFRYSDLVAATRNFSLKNKLGEGGFGPVYKGVLEDGREVAVKKLSSRSRQGTKEFKNEAMLLSKVQHKNIVNLYGYCAVGEREDSGGCEEKLLVYEYVPRESLDMYLFRDDKKTELSWKKRFDIIVAVARGLLYLHEDAHTTIIHRDIKAANILLDDNWMPKIADFGMARLYPEDQTHVNTRVAGTNGYMAPEYVMHGQLSTKADVFSYGVLTLELISGHKNSTFLPQSDGQSLLEWVWILHNRGQISEILDAVLQPTAPEDQVAMCIHVGLLCTQADPKERPDMRRVVVMLSKNSSSLPAPMRPGFPGSRYRRNPAASTSSYTGELSSRTTIGSGSTTSGSSSSRQASNFASNTRSASHSQSASTTTKIRSGALIHERHSETI